MLITTLRIDNAPLRSFTDGDLIIKEGQAGSKVYILYKGELSVSQHGKHITDLSDSGQVIGEIAHVLGKNYSATVTAKGDVSCFVIDNFQNFLRQNPEESWGIIRMLCERVANTTDQLSGIKQEFSS